MKEPIDIVESDPFDPEVVREAENLRHETAIEQNDEVSTYIRRRNLAYKRVFGNAEYADDIEVVLLDLAAFCRGYEPTFDLNQKLQDLKEGRREVYNRIVDFTRLNHDALYLKLTDARMRTELK